MFYISKFSPSDKQQVNVATYSKLATPRTGKRRGQGLTQTKYRLRNLRIEKTTSPLPGQKAPRTRSSQKQLRKRNLKNKR